jgi:hypothetical protein
MRSPLSLNLTGWLQVGFHPVPIYPVPISSEVS